MIKKLEDIALVMKPGVDKSALAKDAIVPGTVLNYNGAVVEVRNHVWPGHRFAIEDIEEGEYITQYGYAFGRSKGIKKGEAITTDNIDNVVPEPSGSTGEFNQATTLSQAYQSRTFRGFRREDGRAGTRNYYLIIAASLCAGETVKWAAEAVGSEVEGLYKNIDGIRAISHTEGCGCASNFQIDRLKTVIRGYASHPNVGGCLIIDLGCEKTNFSALHDFINESIAPGSKPLDWLTIQDCGGTASTVKKAVELIKSRLPELDRHERQDCPVSGLTIGAECGASDSFSGITANPVIGRAVDKIIYGGGSGIISEIPEMLGTYNMLFPRFRSKAVADKFLGLIRWYEDIASKLGVNLYDNLVPKNMEGGLLNSYIKSIGAALKGGSTVIEDVVEYAEPLKKQGLNIMQGPGADPESVSGLVASGANLVCFSTGYGAVSGNPVCPVIKISSNSRTFGRMMDDMDFDAGRILGAGATIETLGDELFELVIESASGKKTATELTRQNQFQVWTAGKLAL